MSKFYSQINPFVLYWVSYGSHQPLKETYFVCRYRKTLSLVKSKYKLLIAFAEELKPVKLSLNIVDHMFLILK